MAREMNVAIIGTKFMGKAHSHAWKSAPDFFQMNIRPVLKVACGRDAMRLKTFAENWGWQDTETDWRQVIARDDVDIVDIAAPQYLHRDIAIAAAQSGKHIFCEKPIALSVAQAREMLSAAQAAGVVHYLNHNYRRAPAVMLARQLIDEGRIGRIFHWRGAYLQSRLADPNWPLSWQLQKEFAGAGPQFDLNSHSVDFARFLVGEIKTVQAMTSHFVKERPLPNRPATAPNAAEQTNTQMGQVTVEDAAFMVVEFENGALGSFEASRFATGRKNYNSFEIYGSNGALTFNLERLNELQFFSNDDPEHAQGFRDILATERVHAYMANWWPPGHIIGYEHEFTHAVVDFMKAVETSGVIRPNFEDGLAGMLVLEAGLESAATGQRVAVQDQDTSPTSD